MIRTLWKELCPGRSESRYTIHNGVCVGLWDTFDVSTVRIGYADLDILS